MSFQYNDNTHLAGVLEMVRRGCERLYSLGSADKPGLFKANKFGRMTACQRDEALLLGMDGAMNNAAIAKMIGHTPSAVKKLFSRSGIKSKESRGCKKGTSWRFSKFKLVSKTVKQRALRINRAARNARKQTLNLPPK
jgi:hypothetical protein